MCAALPLTQEEDMSWHVSDLQQRLDIAHRIMAEQGMQIAQDHAALVHAKLALAWYGGEFHQLDDGTTVKDRIDDAIAGMSR